jgi:hypothetical protein
MGARKKERPPPGAESGKGGLAIGFKFSGFV